MILPPNLYLDLYNVLYKFLSDEASPGEKKPKVTGVWDHKKKETDTFLVTNLFGVSPRFFINQRTLANKGVDVPIDNEVVIKVVEFIKSSISDLKYAETEWDIKANSVLFQLDEKKIAPPKEIDDIEDDVMREERLLHNIANNPDFFETKIIKTLITDYFEAISSGRYLAAWEMLSPNLRKNGLWDGDFRLFKRSYSKIKSVKFKHQFEGSYSYQTILCNFHYDETGTVYDLKNLVDNVEEETIEKETILTTIHHLEEYIEQYIDEYEAGINHINWAGLREVKKLKDMSVEELDDCNFQKCFSVFKPFSERNLNNKAFVQNAIKYNVEFQGLFTFVFIEGKWLIDKMISFQLSLIR
jgi:hypothetical protein